MRPVIVVGVDRSPTLAAAAGAAGSTVVLADAVTLPVADRGADLAVAFMSLQDMDDPETALLEIARVVGPGGRAVVAVVHPVNGSGRFTGEPHDPAAPFLIDGSYLASRRYADDVEREGLTMRFPSDHHSLDTWSRMIERSGLIIEAVREVGVEDEGDRWSRIPLFLHLRLARLS